MSFYQNCCLRAIGGVFCNNHLTPYERLDHITRFHNESTHLDCKIKNSIISSFERSKKLSKKVQKSLRLRPNELHQTLIDAFISLSRLLHSTNACKKTLTFFFLNITQTISLCNFFSVEFIFLYFLKVCATHMCEINSER